MRFLLIFLLLLTGTVAAAKQLHVAVISDGPNEQPYIIEDILVEELIALVEGEFDVRTKRFEANWSLQSVKQVLSQAYSDPIIDMVLVTGFAANQISVTRKRFPKPTFLPVVFDAELSGHTITSNTAAVSGKANLSFIVDRVAFRDSLMNFLRITPLKRIALLGDELSIEAIPLLTEYARLLANKEGVHLQYITHDGVNHDLVSSIPDDIDGVMLAAFPRMPDADFHTMINQINLRKLPSFSLLGPDRVAQGMLATDTPATDWRRLARRNALNMQAVMLGERAEDQPTIFESKHQLILNMETARKIGLSPSFDILETAVLMNEVPENQGPVYSLVTVAHLAVERNLQLNAQSYGLRAGQENISNARANLLPKLSLGSSYIHRKRSPAVEVGQLAEKTTDSSAVLSQTLYSDSAWANLTIQRYLQLDREAAFEQSRLDIIQTATLAYLNVLRANTQMRVQQDNLNLTKTNLELARNRLQVGSSSAADVYRWESRIASDRASLMQATATLNQAKENLNRILNRPIDEVFRMGIVRKGDPFTMETEEFEKLVNNRRDYNFFMDYFLQQGLKKAPELAQLNAQLVAKQREITRRKRAFWLPDFSVSGSYGKNLNQAGAGAGLGEDLSDWNVAINANLPLLDGGARKADLRRARLELKQLQTLYTSAREQVKQRIRSTLYSAEASYSNIDLSIQAAEAGKKNLELVTDSYAKGVVSIIDLLDAQNASLQADEAAANAVYNFLIDIMNMQRSVGLFEFMLSESEQALHAQQMREYLQKRKSAQTLR